MPYAQPSPKVLLGPERLNRRILLALEVFDPVAQALVYRGVQVTAKGLDGGPIVSWSGRFVWLAEADKWPDEISVAPVGLPFGAEKVSPPRPPDLNRVVAAERLIRIVLRPTAAYPFHEGVTAIRGRLLESADPASPPVRDARIQLAWHQVDADIWLPAPPPTGRDASTDDRGEFGVFLRLPSTLLQTPDIENGRLRVRLQFNRGGVLRATPDDFPFLADPASRGRVAEGQLLPRDLTLSWADLAAI